jgi:hypothetical protein
VPIDFQPAVRTDTAIVLALAGASGSGKTKSALELAVGLAGADGRILLIDTEGRRALHYADEYRFFHHEWRPPFAPAALGALLRAAERQGFAVVIVDSMSDEHEGEGGLCDMAAAALQEQRGDTRNSAAAWARPKAEHKHHIVRWLRQTPMHVIFCLRADERVRFEKTERNGREVTVVVAAGWQPIAEKRLLYDVTTSLLFTPEPGRAGMPQPIKLYDKHAPFFPPDRRIARAAGAALARWAAGAAAVARAIDPATALRLQAEDVAHQGKEAFRIYWRALTAEQKAILKADLPQIRRIAETSAPTSTPDNRAAPDASVAEAGDGARMPHRDRGEIEIPTLEFKPSMTARDRADAVAYFIDDAPDERWLDRFLDHNAAVLHADNALLAEVARKRRELRGEAS